MIDRTSLWLLAGVLVLTCGLAAAGYGYYSHERAAIRDLKRTGLRAVAELKTREIARWRRDQEKDARLSSTGIVRSLALSLTDGVGDESERRDLLARMTAVRDARGYQNLILARPDGSVVLSIDPHLVDLDAQARRLVGQVVSSRDAVFGELFRCEVCDQVHQDVAAPILDEQRRVAAVLVQRIDPDAVLFSLVQFWPTHSPSAETLLVRRDGDDALLLNVLRHKPAPALSVRIPLTRTDVPGVQAALGKTGGFDGHDYRGVDVLAEILPVAGSPWSIVAKVDQDELRAEVRSDERLILALVVLAVLVVGTLGQLVHRTLKSRLQQDLFRSERARAEAVEQAIHDLEASESRYRRLFEAARDGILILDAESGEIVDVNPFLVELTGYSHEEFLGKRLWEIGSFSDIAASEEAFAELQARKYIRYENLPLKTRDGRKVAVEFVSNVYLVNGHKVIQCNVRDITARKQAESELLQSEERFRILFEQAADCIFLLQASPDGMPIIRAANKATFGLLGYRRDELIGQPITFLDAAPEAATATDEMRKNIGSGTGAFIELAHRCKDGTIRYFECSVKGMQIDSKPSLISVERDVTERKRMAAERQRLEEQLRVSQKLESIGTLASGVAHEINNPLNVIMNYGQLILDGNAEAAHVKDYALNIVKESDRVAVIVRDLLGFARQETETDSPARIGDIVGKTLSLVRAVLRKDQIAVQCEIPEGLPAIRCRSQQIQQVFMNLLTNARDALNQRYPTASDDKTIRVEASSFQADGVRWVRLTVADLGAGIPPEIAGKVFDPFFTTKTRDRGTGLGLSISYGIVKEHHGNLWFESEPGSGTRFHVDLKADDEELVAESGRG